MTDTTYLAPGPAADITPCPACHGSRRIEFIDHNGRYVIQPCRMCNGDKFVTPVPRDERLEYRRELKI